MRTASALIRKAVKTVFKRYSLIENCERVEEVSALPKAAFACDILVAGAGSAGIYAASAAAENGCDVILLERDASIGGMHVLGNVHGYYYGDEGGAYAADDADCRKETAFFGIGTFPEVKQSREVKRLLAAGVTIKERHVPVAIYADEASTVWGLDVFDGECVRFFKAKLVIDATSDGHLVRMLPVVKHYGRGTDGKTVPFTVRTQFITPDGNYRAVNSDSGFIDAYDAFGFSDKVRYAHANALRLLKTGSLLSLASHAGVREGLTFEGEETMRYEDLIYDRAPEKVLFYAYSDLDKHGHDYALDEPLFQDWFFLCNMATVTIHIPVPMGVIVPRGFHGFLTAGRCLSCDSYAQSAVRMNRDMFRMGECVGVAAAMAVKAGCDVLAIDYHAYVNAVRKRGCYDGVPGRRYGYDYPGKNKPYAPVSFSLDDNLPLLATNAPGPALWAARRAKDDAAAVETVCSVMQNASSILERENAATALGLMEDRRALPVLRLMVKNRSPQYYTSSRRSNSFPSANAICLIGRIGEKEDVSLLEEIVFDAREIEKPCYHVLKRNYLYYNEADRNILYFYHFTFAAMALVSLYRRHGLALSALHARFEALFSDDGVKRRVTREPDDSPSTIEIADFIRHLLKITDENSQRS